MRRNVRSVPPRSWGLLVLKAFFSFSGVTAWNRGLGGSSLGAYHVTKALIPLWSAVAQVAQQTLERIEPLPIPVHVRGPKSARWQ